jgi:hypothetical protein
MSDKYLEDLSLPPVMALPPMPDDEEDLLRWAKEVHVVLQNSYVPQADRIENLNMADDGTTRRPDSKGTRRFFYDAKDDVVSFDAKVAGEDRSEWVSIGGAGAYLPLAGGTLTGDLIINANLDLNGTLDVSGAAAFDSTIDADDDITLANNKFLLGEDTGDTARNLLGIDGSNLTQLNDTATDMIIWVNSTCRFAGGDYVIDNNNEFGGRNAANTDNHHIASVNSSDETELAEPGHTTKIWGSLIQLNAQGGDVEVVNGDFLVTNGNIEMDANDRYLVGENTTGGNVFLAGVGTDNKTYFGYSGYDMQLASNGEFRFNDGDILLYQNNTHLRGRTSGGTETDIIGIDSANDLIIGTTTVDLIKLMEQTYVDNGGIELMDNNEFFSGRTAGAASKNLAGINASAQAEIGDSSVNMLVQALHGMYFGFGSTGSRFLGLRQGVASAPGTGTLTTSGDFCIWEETDTNIFTWYINDSGTIRQIS